MGVELMIPYDYIPFRTKACWPWTHAGHGMNNTIYFINIIFSGASDTHMQ
jgi:hypothetical protein